MQIRPTAFTIGLIIHPSIALFCVYTEFGIDSLRSFLCLVSLTQNIAVRISSDDLEILLYFPCP